MPGATGHVSEGGVGSLYLPEPWAAASGFREACDRIVNVI
jgi:hypothetical protein